jgi:hypothetical protein
MCLFISYLFLIYSVTILVSDAAGSRHENDDDLKALGLEGVTGSHKPPPTSTVAVRSRSLFKHYVKQNILFKKRNKTIKTHTKRVFFSSRNYQRSKSGSTPAIVRLSARRFPQMQYSAQMLEKTRQIIKK